MRRLLPCALLLLLPAAGEAQEAAGDPMMRSARQLYEAGKGFIMSTAEQTPEEEYGFRPVPTVRSLGQVLGHVADVHFVACSIGLGEDNPNPASVEQANPGRTALLDALRRSYALCDRAYAQSDDTVAAPAELFGQQTTRLHALNLNVTHDFEHYGNLVTYLRLRGRVPPSSQAAQ